MLAVPALDGLRVIEIGQMISGPFCGHLFADHGAEVIKVEPESGDVMRTWGLKHNGLGLYWPIISRGKKSVILDLRSAEGQQDLRRLAATADVIVENFRPGTLEGWGLGPDDLHRVNPDLTIVRISGFGQDGPYRDRAGFGSIAEAMSGFRHLVAEPGRPPVRVGISLGDSLAGTQGFIGALLALLARARGAAALGQVIDVGLYEAMWMYMEGVLPEFDKLGAVRQPTGSTLPNIAPSNVYPTASGELVVIGANNDAVFARLATLMGRPDWTDAEGPYRTGPARGDAQEALDASIASWSATIETDRAARAPARGRSPGEPGVHRGRHRAGPALRRPGDDRAHERAQPRRRGRSGPGGRSQAEHHAGRRTPWRPPARRARRRGAWTAAPRCFAQLSTSGARPSTG